MKLAGDAAYWHFDAFKKAVLMGVDDARKPLKKPMPVFGKVGLTVPKGEIPTDAELHDIQAYVVSFGPKKRPSVGLANGTLTSWLNVMML